MMIDPKTTKAMATARTMTTRAGTSGTPTAARRRRLSSTEPRYTTITAMPMSQLATGPKKVLVSLVMPLSVMLTVPVLPST